MKLRTLLFAVLALAGTAAQAVDLSNSMILVAKPELVDQLYGSTVLVVTPVGRRPARRVHRQPPDRSRPSASCSRRTVLPRRWSIPSTSAGRSARR